MRIAIVDGVRQDREELREMISNCMEDCGVVAEFTLFPSGEALLKEYIPEEYTLLLLSLAQDGMKLAQDLRSKGDRTPLIFLAGSDAYAVQSYQVDAENYLLKPLDQAVVKRAMTHFLGKLGNRCNGISITANREQITLSRAQIFWIESQQNAVQIHLKEESVKAYMTFSGLMKQIGEDNRFLLCCRGCLVNMDHVDCLEEDDFRLSNGETVPIRHRGSKQIRQQYTQYRYTRMQNFAL